jgi:hypothetical protein
MEGRIGVFQYVNEHGGSEFLVENMVFWYRQQMSF